MMANTKADDVDKEFTPEVYRVAAEEHLDALEDLYSRGFYALAIYVAGVAVESMFRAYRCKIDSAFDSRHNLYELAKTARFVEIVPPEQMSAYRDALREIAARWSNNHRFRSNAAVRAFFRRAKLNREVKGDFLKENVRLAIKFATAIVNIGSAKWKR